MPRQTLKWIRELSIAVHQNALLTRVAQFENDSSYGDELSSYNASLTSSVIDYRHENEQWFKEAGFVNIHVEKFVIPYGVWPKDPHLKKVGAWNQTQAEANGFEAAALAPLTRFKQWRKEEVIFLASKARADGRNRNIHMMFDL
ncbi:hypothetical protein VTN31DRAFT_5142 [Thermomyces dupontii]|uniref:uncharacterized protein n=1 Tax=Talaromyces thermophilus TaxID=28565 RepID=UPI0037433538